MIVTKDLYDKLSKLKTGYLDKGGHEILNPRSMAIPSGLNRPPSLQEQIKRVLKVELSRQAAEQDMETFEESQDFKVSDEFDTEELQTQYELVEEEYPIMEEKMENEEKPAEPEPPSEGVKKVAGEETNEPEAAKSNTSVHKSSE